MNSVKPIVAILVIAYLVALLVKFEETILLTLALVVTGGIVVIIQKSEKGKLN